MVMMAELKEEKAEGIDAAMLTVDQVARMLCCSPRTVRRLTDAGRMPRPVRLGSLLRWPLESVENWISQGCPRREERRS